ncbi:MAG: hypothetical protein J6N95_05775 [Bacilli bacterium]|jgi:repressor of nif and glnA expression|nr:hypothetical protein [Bacilli bacterium]
MIWGVSNDNHEIVETDFKYDMTRQAVNYYIKKLKEKNIIRKVNGDKGGHREIVE